MEKVSNWACQWKMQFNHAPNEQALTIYKSFIRPHLDYGDILYDKPDKRNFQNKKEKI